MPAGQDADHAAAMCVTERDRAAVSRYHGEVACNHGERVGMAQSIPHTIAAGAIASHDRVHLNGQVDAGRLHQHQSHVGPGCRPLGNKLRVGPAGTEGVDGAVLAWPDTLPCDADGGLCDRRPQEQQPPWHKHITCYRRIESRVVASSGIEHVLKRDGIGGERGVAPIGRAHF